MLIYILDEDFLLDEVLTFEIMGVGGAAGTRG